MQKNKETKNEFMTIKEWEQLLKEFVIMKEEFRIMKDVIREKLGVEIKLF